MSSEMPPTSLTPTRRRRRRLPIVLVLLLLVGVLGAAAGSGVVAMQSRSLATAADERDSARAAVDRGLRLARLDGVDPARLGAIVDRERAILAEAPRGSLIFFDGGETAHLKDERDRLLTLTNEVTAAETADVATLRSSAVKTLDEFHLVIVAGGNVGVDTKTFAATEASLRGTVDGASSPVAILGALAGIPGQIDALRGATAKKVADDADYHAAVNSAHDDAQRAVSRMQGVLAQAQQNAQYRLGPTQQGVDTITAGLAKATTLDEYVNIIQQANKVVDDLRGLMSAHDQAQSDLQAALTDFHSAQGAGQNTWDVGPRLDAQQQSFNNANTADDFDNVDNNVFNIITPLDDALGITLPSGKAIAISLTHQTMTTFENGVPVISTLVTTGRPELPTPPGETSVMSKSHPFQMVGIWPKSSPFYYPPSWVQYVLWFRDGGYGIHDAPWRGSYGPGTNGNNGTHGCVNVPARVIAQVFNWADIGTPVIVH